MSRVHFFCSIYSQLNEKKKLIIFSNNNNNNNCCSLPIRSVISIDVLCVKLKIIFHLFVVVCNNFQRYQEKYFTSITNERSLICNIYCCYLKRTKVSLKNKNIKTNYSHITYILLVC